MHCLAESSSGCLSAARGLAAVSEPRSSFSLPQQWDAAAFMEARKLIWGMARQNPPHNAIELPHKSTVPFRTFWFHTRLNNLIATPHAGPEPSDPFISLPGAISRVTQSQAAVTQRGGAANSSRSPTQNVVLILLPHAARCACTMVGCPVNFAPDSSFVLLHLQHQRIRNLP